MRNPTYRYNPETFRYERSRTTAKEVIWYVLSVAFTSCLMLAGLLTLHDFLTNSEKEIAWRKENAALEKHSILLTKQIQEVETTLASLHQKDKELHAKFFSSSVEIQSEEKNNSDPNILLADASQFRNTLLSVQERSEELIRQASQTNKLFSDNNSLRKDNLNILYSIPTLQPVRSLQPEIVLSGFGMRINPYHKGLYNHPGIDIAVPRGTEVLATAAGKVTEIKLSDLQAGYGNYLEIAHGHGFITRYAHLEAIVVKAGQKISKGDVIATTGNSGGSIAPHLHYEIIKNGVNVDPILYMFEGLTTLQHEQLKSVGSKQNQSLD